MTLLGKAKPSHPLNGAAHTAGLFADMSLDGPEIGTLVTIVDRGKNLPNRKTIGKQDPYCACRLGKEAKRTATDVRGGQTPRWDQELRFTVHDSADYYQLKVSVFNDDKKTDLIGEAWIDLRQIVVSGGGQSDKWHTLTCKGKYAGEIRMEVTFYDSRPKPDKPVQQLKATPSSVSSATSSNPRNDVQRVTAKRRPLPSDPITGKAPPVPAAPLQLQTAPKSLPAAANISTQSPLQAIEYQTPPSTRPKGPQAQPSSSSTSLNQYPQGSYRNNVALQPIEPPAPAPPQRSIPEPTPPPPRQSLQALQQQMIEDHDLYGNGYAENGQQSPGGYQLQHQQLPPQQMQPQPPQHQQLPRLPAPPQHQQQQEQQRQYDGQYDQPDPRHDQRYDSRDVYDDRDMRQPPYSAPSSHNLPPVHDPRQLPPDEDTPPPPPVHRSRPGSGQDFTYRSTYDTSPVKDMSMRHDVLRNEAHRTSFHPSSAYPGRPQYNPPPPAVPQHGRSDSQGEEYHQSPRHQSYDGTPTSPYDSHRRSLQPTVEDDPDSPPSTQHQHNSFCQSETRPPTYHTPDYDQATSPAPLNISGRNSAASGMSGHRSPSAANPPAHDYGSNYGRSPSPIPQDYRRPSTGPSPRHSFTDQRSPSPLPLSRSEIENNELALVPHHSSAAYRSSEVPPSLIPGVDPYLAQDITERVYEERRPERRYTQQDMSTPTRGRQRPSMDRRGSSYGFPDPPPQEESYAPPSWQQDDSRALVRHSTYSITQSGYDSAPVSRPRRETSPAPFPRPQGTSPAPQHNIKRKSVSPIPPPSDTRRHSEIPFGPDSYDEFNPNVERAKNKDPDSKIIMHDGREIDPSDHLPMSSWAPEPEPRETTPETRARPSPVGSQPMPSSGRRQIRVQASTRPQSMSISGQSYMEADSSPHTSGSGRNRLQKRSTQRMPALPAPPPPQSMTSGPLVPINNAPGGSGFTPPRHLSRATTFDYNGAENREPAYGSSPGNRGSYRDDYRARFGSSVGSGGSGMGGGDRDDGYDRGFRSSVPARDKAPLQLTMSGANGTNGDRNDENWALMQEMQSIDLGAGRSRRHRGF